MAVKVTLTLPADLIAAVDRHVDEHSGATRSKVCAEALREWLRTKQEAAIAVYYLSQSEAERAEDHAWTATTAENAATLWQ